MLIALTKKPSFLVFLGLWFIFSLYVFLSYRAIHSADEMIITPFALKIEFTFPDSWIAEFEIDRRVRNGSLRNSEFFSYVLTIATVPGINRDAAYDLADSILESGLNINSYESALLPLHTAITVNNSEAVSYLLSRCADPFALTAFGRSNNAQQTNAFELLERLQEIDPAVDRGAVTNLMGQWKPMDECSGR